MVRFQVHSFIVIILSALAMPWIMGQTNDEDENLSIDISSLGNRLYGQPQELAAELVRQWQAHFGSALPTNPEELGPYAEGDILNTHTPIVPRNGLYSDAYRWRKGIIPFEIIGTFSTNELEIILAAMEAYHKHTCIKFVPRTKDDPDFISIQNGNSGCWSSVGRVGGRQVVNLQSPGCLLKRGTPMHELMHVVGFLHEQNRKERDQYVDIRLQNVNGDRSVNFEKAATGVAIGFGVGYDYGSILHYSEYAFSKNGAPTIVPKHKTTAIIGQRTALSEGDIKKIQNMYKCTRTTEQSDSDYVPIYLSDSPTAYSIDKNVSNTTSIHQNPLGQNKLIKILIQTNIELNEI